MALITDAGLAWTGPVSLAGDEIWQAREGSVYITTTAAPDPDDGVLLVQGAAVHLSAGLTVQYRTHGLTKALIAREAI